MNNMLEDENNYKFCDSCHEKFWWEDLKKTDDGQEFCPECYKDWEDWEKMKHPTKEELEWAMEDEYATEKRLEELSKANE